MKRSPGSLELDVRVDSDGTVTIPSRYLGKLGLRAGSRLKVKLTNRVLSRDLVALGVTEEEIEHVGQLQLEDRSNVAAFLRAQGALSSDRGFRRRMKTILP